MYNTTAEYKAEIKKPSRSFECKVTAGDKVFTNEDIVDIIIEHPQPADGFTIGNTPSKTLDLTILNKGDTIYSTNQIKVEIGLNIGDRTEYILMGYFNIDEISKTDYTIKITAYDNMIKFETPYFSSLGDTATLQQIADELASKTGVQFIGTLPSYSLKKLEGFSCREILGYIASLCGGNACITREGKFTISYPKEISYSIDANNYFDYKREETEYRVGKVTCKAGEDKLSKGSLGVDSMEVQFENPWVTEGILQDIYNKINGFSYLGYSMKWQGDISLDPWDLISIVDKKGITRKQPILSQKFNYTGGLTVEMGAKGESKNKNSFSSSGDNSKKISRIVTQLALVDKAFVDYAHINDAEIVSLKAKDAEINNALIYKADIKDLEATNGNIKNLVAEDARINNALISKANITDLNVVHEKVNVLEADSATIKTLVAGNIKADNMQADFLQTLKGWMLEGSIGNAQISSLDANKIRSGTVDTSLVTVAGPGGRLTIQGNKLQVFDIKDNKLYERIMLGIDSNNNSSLTLRGADGNTVLLTQDGLTKSGFTDGYNKVDNGSLDGVKLDINSVVRRVNNATEKIESTVVNVGGKTLNVLLQEQTNTITEHGKSLSNQETRITTNENSIKLKVDMQTYSQDKTNITNRIGVVEGNISTVNSNLSKATADISVLQNQIALKVEQGAIDNSISKIEIGGRNLILDTIFKNIDNLSYWVPGRCSYAKLGDGEVKLTYIINNTPPVFYNRKIFPLENDKYYTLSFMAKVDGSNVADKIVVTADTGVPYTAINTFTNVKNNTYKNYEITFKLTGITAPTNVCINFYFYPIDTTKSEAYMYLKDIKLEEGNKATAWTPAPEDVEQAIADVVTTTDTKISSAKAEIKATTDSISANVSNLTSRTTSVETQLGDKVSTAQLKVVTDKQATIEANLNGITQRVSSTENKVISVESIANNANEFVSNAKRNLGFQYATDIIVYGESNKFYPVVIKGGNQDVKRKILVARSYSELAPPDWYSSTHKGGLTLLIETNFGGWGGANYSWNIQAFEESYCNMFAGAINCGHNVMFAIFLRGGGTTGAIYHLYSDQSLTATGYYDMPLNGSGQLPSPQICYNQEYIFYNQQGAYNYDEKAPVPRNLTDDVKEEINSRLYVKNSQESRVEIKNVKSQVSSIETNLGYITSRVANVESTTSTINGKVINQETRLQSAESKLTPNGLTTTISQAINAGGVNKIDTTSVTIAIDGLTIKNGAIKVQNRSGKNVLYADTNGNLSLDATLLAPNVIGNLITDTGVNVMSVSKSYRYALHCSGGEGFFLTQFNSSGAFTGHYLEFEPNYGMNTVFHTSMRPSVAASGAVDMGHPNARWRTIYATNGSIQTSDKREKTNIKYIQDSVEEAPKLRSFSLASTTETVEPTKKDYYDFFSTMDFATWDWKNPLSNTKGLETNLGFIAQDVQDSNVGKMFIVKNEDGTLAYSQSNYVNALGIALQQAIKEIEILKQKLGA